VWWQTHALQLAICDASIIAEPCRAVHSWKLLSTPLLLAFLQVSEDNLSGSSVSSGGRDAAGIDHTQEAAAAQQVRHQHGTA
jgi:hypothetical protein